jgi:argininosuccinate lyase
MTVARGKRLSGDTSAAMQALNTSVETDQRLWRQDIRGSIAHARGLVAAGVLSAQEAGQLVEGLERVAREIEDGTLKWDANKEDVHMNIEARLTEIVGPVGGKLHTGRSRNDQVATDLRLWVREQGQEALGAIAELARVIVGRAANEIDTLMPAYTHLQRAQPSRLSHHLLAWQELLSRDHERLHAALERANECPLGSGAVAGTGFALDRHAVARELGFAGPTRNSIDATASRDFLMEVGSALCILAVHLSRIGEEIVIWSSSEFGFIKLSDEYATSSSMMPQKKNPDVAELIRGKAARAIGDLTSLLVLEKSLSFGYGRDLQEDKVPLFSLFDSALLGLRALAGALGTLTFERDRLAAALQQGHLCATDLADALVTQGMPFREAHHLVGDLVKVAETRGVQLHELDEQTLRAASPLLATVKADGVFDLASAVERRKVFGGPARERVLEQIAWARQRWQA